MSKAKSFTQDQIDDYTSGLNFPASKSQVVEHARRQNVPSEVLSRLEEIPDKEYGSLGDVLKETAKGGF